MSLEDLKITQESDAFDDDTPTDRVEGDGLPPEAFAWATGPGTEPQATVEEEGYFVFVATVGPQGSVVLPDHLANDGTVKEGDTLFIRAKVVTD